VVNSEQFSGEPARYKLQKSMVYLPLIEEPIMSLWRRRQDYSDAMIRDFFITLAQIALTFGAVLLWFFG
jgi:hypothetical protein